MNATGAAINFDSLAREAVSRSWLYTQHDLRTEIEQLRERRPARSMPTVPNAQRASDAALQSGGRQLSARARCCQGSV
jgi:hypothetical protein